MSQLENTSAILGEYMLKGWTLTDLHCSECRVTPLMREPNAIAERENRERIQFCALCDGRPEGRAGASSHRRQDHAAGDGTGTASTVTTTQDAADEIEAAFASASSAAQDDHAPASSSSPADDAASSISSLLLRGYSLLGDNCPNPTCRGIPLVGYPRKADGSKDGRKMCVCCEGRWVDESAVESEGMKVVQQQQRQHQTEGEAGAESPRTKARRELYGLSSEGDKKEKVEAKNDKGKSRVIDPDEFEARANESAKRLHAAPASGEGVSSHQRQHHDDDAGTDSAATHILPIRPSPYKPTPPSPSSALGQSLSQTSDSLSQTLKSLSTSLERCAAPLPSATAHGIHSRPDDGDNGRWFVDLKLHTEAIKDVLGVIGQVERARRVGY
ncbi:hypothetical protein I316_07687 [Kwoniella heveanensis BCC8398]|uniref:Uncharacterized protein n=1 Tax=Kwoniella heveanensis BCC8398 TaxID=1296120 RepID=A0A1B9GHW0_9TREE|nr:hypothetical protein I316_07687 [Kwoniella heveanensis BCC8398]